MIIENGNGSGSPESPVDLAALNARLALWQKAANNTPDPETGRLSPTTVHRLLYEPWGEEKAIIQFRSDLALDDLAGAPIFLRARRLLEVIHAAGGVKATPKGNLTRALVREFLDDPNMAEGEYSEVLRTQKAVNEEDFFTLHVAKLICRCSGLLRLQKGRLEVTIRGSRLLQRERVGELYVRLLTGCFRKFNLAYAYRQYLDAPALQRCVGYTLYRLREEASDWHSTKALYPKVFLPAVREQVEKELKNNTWTTPAESVGDRIFAPLIDFGLLKGRFERIFRSDHLKAVRITPLFQRVFAFDEQETA